MPLAPADLASTFQPIHHPSSSPCPALIQLRVEIQHPHDTSNFALRSLNLTSQANPLLSASSIPVPSKPNTRICHITSKRTLSITPQSLPQMGLIRCPATSHPSISSFQPSPLSPHCGPLFLISVAPPPPTWQTPFFICSHSCMHVQTCAQKHTCIWVNMHTCIQKYLCKHAYFCFGVF